MVTKTLEKVLYAKRSEMKIAIGIAYQHSDPQHVVDSFLEFYNQVQSWGINESMRGSRGTFFIARKNGFG